MAFFVRRCVVLGFVLLGSGCDDEVRRPGDVPGADTLVCLEIAAGPDLLTPAVGELTLLGDHVYAPAMRGGKPAIAVLELGDGTVRLVGEADGINGYLFTQPWQHVSGTTYAKLQASALDVIDARDPLRPKKQTWTMGQPVEGASGTLGRVGTDLFACVSGPEGGGSLVVIDSAAPPGPAEAVATDACRDPWLFGSASSGDLWADLTWVGPTHETPALTLYSLESGDVLLSSTLEDGLLAGLLVLGDALAATWSYDETTLRLFYPGTAEPVAVPNPGVFQFIIDGVGYAFEYDYTAPPVVRSFDLNDPDAIETSEVTLLPGPRSQGEYGYQLQVSHDEHRVLVSNERGDIWVIPPGKTGELEPLVWVTDSGTAACPWL